jgi:cytochrome c oxidase assembly protein subunit 15
MILALVIISIFVWTYFELYYAQFSFFSISLLNIVTAMLLLTTITFGALVAGLKAGLVYNTFPLMGRDLIPIEVGTFMPIWRDILENPVTVQLVHRLLALITAFAIIYSSILYYSRVSAQILICCIVTQLSLGIATLIMHVPLLFAILHQLFGVILFISLLYFFYDSNNCVLRRKNS